MVIQCDCWTRCYRVPWIRGHTGSNAYIITTRLKMCQGCSPRSKDIHIGHTVVKGDNSFLMNMDQASASFLSSLSAYSHGIIITLRSLSGICPCLWSKPALDRTPPRLSPLSPSYRTIRCHNVPGCTDRTSHNNSSVDPSLCPEDTPEPQGRAPMLKTRTETYLLFTMEWE